MWNQEDDDKEGINTLVIEQYVLSMATSRDSDVSDFSDDGYVNALASQPPA
jgi:hypothetical protein